MGVGWKVLRRVLNIAISKMKPLIPHIRSLHRDELRKAWQLQKKGFPCLDEISREDYLKFRSNKKFDFDQIIVAEVDDRVIGKIEVYSWKASEKGKTGFVDGFIVDPNYRKLGVGTQLLLEAEKRAVKKGISQIDLGAKTFCKDAIALYEKLGYTKLHRVFFMRIPIGNLHVPELPEDIIIRSADPSQDLQKIFEISPNVWWSRYTTEKELRQDIENNRDRFLVLERGREVRAYMKYSLGEDIFINCFGTSIPSVLPLVTVTRYLLKKVLDKATNQKTLEIEVDEQKRELVMVLKLLGFENYETEYHMTKQLSPKRGSDCQERR